MLNKQPAVTMTTVTPRLVPRTIKALIEDHYAFFLLGNPGIGKTEMVWDTLASMGLAGVDLRGATMAEVDGRGVPFTETDETGQRWTRWARPETWPVDGTGCIFMDEYNRSTPAVQNVLMQVVHDHRVAGHVIPETWTYGAAGNKVDVGVYKMSEASRDRFTFLNVVVDNDDWTKWAIESQKIEPVVIAFLHLCPNLLSTYDEKAIVNATPRSWERASVLISRHHPKEVQHVLLAGTVGEEAAVKFAAFEPVFKQIPNVDAIIADPTRADVPPAEQAGLRVALASALSFKATEDNLAPILTYLARLPGEYAAFATADMIHRDKALQHTREYMHYAANNNIADRYN